MQFLRWGERHTDLSDGSDVLPLGRTMPTVRALDELVTACRKKKVDLGDGRRGRGR
jgi:hypothetical protein